MTALASALSLSIWISRKFYHKVPYYKWKAWIEFEGYGLNCLIGLIINHYADGTMIVEILHKIYLK